MANLSNSKLTAVFTKLRTYVAVSDLYNAMREDDYFDYNMTFYLKEPMRVFTSGMEAIFIESFAVIRSTRTVAIYTVDGREYESDLLIEGTVESIIF